MTGLGSIVDEFVHDDPGCPYCQGTGHVCEAHPGRPWYPLVEDGCGCGAPGMPCPKVPG